MKDSNKVFSVYFRNDENEYLKMQCEKTGKTKSAYLRSLLNRERFGDDQLEMDLDLSKNTLPELFRKIKEIEKRVNDLEK